MSAAERFLISQNCAKKTLGGVGGSVTLTNGGIASCIWTLAPMESASKSLFSGRFIRFSNSRFQDNMHCFFLSRNMLMQINLYSEVRWNIVMKIIWRENLFPNTAKLMHWNMSSYMWLRKGSEGEREAAA